MLPTDSLTCPSFPSPHFDQNTGLAFMLAACMLMNSKPEMTPYEAVRDVWQVYKRIQTFSPSSWPW